MKKLIILAAALVLLLALAACSNSPAALAPPVPEPGEAQDIDVDESADYEYDLEMDEDFEFGDVLWPDMADMDVFGSWTGTVVEIAVQWTDPPLYIFKLEGDGGSANFIADFNTFTLGSAPEVGDTITGFFLMDMPMAMIYPPQYNVSVIANGEFTNLHVDRFDEELVSYDGSLMLNIDGDTEIILQDGEPFDCELAHRKLVVVYDISTRSIPAQTTPSKIIVLFERFATGPAFL